MSPSLSTPHPFSKDPTSMFEYHGWITIQTSAYDEDTEKLRAAYRQISEEIVSDLASSSGLANLQYINGTAQLHIAGHMNHRGTEGQKVIDHFHRVGQIAPGSYGLLYVRDDEDRNGHDNEFRALAMRKGKVTEQHDSFLSPCIPTIEDED